MWIGENKSEDKRNSKLLFSVNSSNNNSKDVVLSTTNSNVSTTTKNTKTDGKRFGFLFDMNCSKWRVFLKSTSGTNVENLSVEEILLFINEDKKAQAPANAPQKKKKKKKNKKKKQPLADGANKLVVEEDKQESNNHVEQAEGKYISLSISFAFI